MPHAGAPDFQETDLWIFSSCVLAHVIHGNHKAYITWLHKSCMLPFSLFLPLSDLSSVSIESILTRKDLWESG